MQAPSYQANQEQRAGRIALLRGFLGVILALLFLQFLMGMWLNLFATFPSFFVGSSYGMMGSSMSFMMSGGMSILMAHMLSGYVLGILAILVLGISIYSRNTTFVALSVAGLGFIILSGIAGLSFMFSGFQGNLLSYLMALGFISSLAIYFFELYVSVKPLH